MLMRLDKFLTHTGTLSRADAAKAAKAGRISVDGRVIKDRSLKIDPDKQSVALDGATIEYRQFTWIMMNKPDGVVSATEDGRDKTVVDLLPDKLRGMGLFPCGIEFNSLKYFFFSRKYLNTMFF